MVNASFRIILSVLTLLTLSACVGAKTPSPDLVENAISERLDGYSLVELDFEVFPGAEGTGRIAYSAEIRQNRNRYRILGSVNDLMQGFMVDAGAFPRFTGSMVNEAGYGRTNFVELVSGAGSQHRISGEIRYRATANGFDFTGNVGQPDLGRILPDDTRIESPNYVVYVESEIARIQHELRTVLDAHVDRLEAAQRGLAEFFERNLLEGHQQLDFNAENTVLRWQFTPHSDSSLDGWFFDQSNRDPRTFYFEILGEMTWLTAGNFGNHHFDRGQSSRALLVLQFNNHVRGFMPDSITVFLPNRFDPDSWERTVGYGATRQGASYYIPRGFSWPWHLRFGPR